MKKQSVIITILFVFCLSLLLMLANSRIRNRCKYYLSVIKSELGSNHRSNCEGCSHLFNDGIKEHEKAYKYGAITPQQSDVGLLRLQSKKVLKQIESNYFYQVRELDFSQPILVSQAIDFLNDLSTLYYNNCKEKQLTYVPFEITSATRSIESLKKLKDKNLNAIDNSAHLYGKTMDISYAAFNHNKEQLKIFISTLSQLKNQNKCCVKYEANGCLHITAK